MSHFKDDLMKPTGPVTPEMLPGQIGVQMNPSEETVTIKMLPNKFAIQPVEITVPFVIVEALGMQITGISLAKRGINMGSQVAPPATQAPHLKAI